MRDANSAKLPRMIWMATLPATVVLYLVHLLFRTPTFIPTNMSPAQADVLLPALWVSCVIGGYALAMVGCMAWVRWRYWRLYLRLRVRRVILAIGLAAVTPAVFVEIFPIFSWAIYLDLLDRLLKGRSYLRDDMPAAIIFALGVIPVWYVASGLIISVIKSSRLKRAGAFLVAWLGACATVFLLNTVPFNI